MKCFTGVAQRNISSTACGISDGSAFSLANCSGFCDNASSPPDAVLLVVSWPAVTVMA